MMSMATVAHVAKIRANNANHGDGFSVAASPSLQSRACWRRYSGVPCKKSAVGAFIVGGGER